MFYFNIVNRSLSPDLHSSINTKDETLVSQKKKSLLNGSAFHIIQTLQIMNGTLVSQKPKSQLNGSKFHRIQVLQFLQ